MRKTTNYGLALYDLEDKMSITSSENSLNNNMELIDNALKEKATINDMTMYMEEHKDELKGEDGTNGQDGYSPTATVTETSTGAIITITDKNGTTTTNITNGKDGVDGSKGDKGEKGDTGATGTQGPQGEKGEQGYSPIKGIDYWTEADKTEIKEYVKDEIPTKTSQLTNDSNYLKSEVITQEAGESVALIMSQKAVTDLVSNALGSGGTEIEYDQVDSVEEMIDETKQYVLNSTGTIWAFGDFTENINEEVYQEAVPYARNGHMSASSINPAGSQTIYIIPLDISSMPENVEIMVDVVGLTMNGTTSKPNLMKIGYGKTDRASLLSTLSSASSTVSNIIINSNYATVAGIGEGAISAISNGVKFKAGYIGGTKLSEYNDIKTMILEISDTHDTSTITTYLQYSGTVSKWYDTGITPETASAGGNYVELIVKVDKNTSDVAKLDTRVIALETGNDAKISIPEGWEDAVNSCIEKIKSHQIGRNCITFPFFSDNHQRKGVNGQLIAYIMNECKIPYAFFGGDSISNGTIKDEQTMIDQDNAFDLKMKYISNGRFCRAVGNHDGYWKTPVGDKYYYPRTKNFELFLREETISQLKHFGGDGTYYYIDDFGSQVRFIVLDTNPIKKTDEYYKVLVEEDGTTEQYIERSVDEEQFNWLKNVAMKFNEDGWGVVFISHQPITNNYHSNITNAQEVQAWLTSYIKGTTEHKADVIGWFSGHIHRDRIYEYDYTGTYPKENIHSRVNAQGSTETYSLSTDDYPAHVGWSEDKKLPWKTVTIMSDATSIAYDDDIDKTHKTDDDVLSHAIDFVTINRSTRTVYLTRLGLYSPAAEEKGGDRDYTY